MNVILNMEATSNATDRAMDVVKTSLEAAHQIYRVWPETATLRKTKASSDFDFCFSTAQTYLKRYRTLIDSYSSWTKIQVIDVAMEEAQSKSIQEWKSTLDFIEMIIYLNAALKYGAKSAIKHAIKQFFQNQKA